MAATAAQIAAGRQLAQSRGYDPNLVDSDNADRANSAFPVQGGAEHGQEGAAARQTPISQGGGGSGGLTLPPKSDSPNPFAAIPTHGGGNPSIPGDIGGGSAGGGAVPDSVSGLAKVVDPGMSSMGGMNLGSGGGGATGMSEGDSLAGLLGATTGGLRSLGRRSPAMESTDVAQRGKRVY